MQVFISKTLKRLLNIPIDRYYLKFAMSDIKNKNMVMMNYNKKNMKNPYDKMQLLKRYENNTNDNDKKIDGTNNVYVKQQKKMHSNVVTICQYELHPSQSIVQAGATEISNITAKLQSFNNDLVQNADNLNNNVNNLKLEGIEYYNGSNINSLLYGKHYLHTTNSIGHQVRQGDALIERRMVHSRLKNAAY
jgi:hypothetical protein